MILKAIFSRHGLPEVVNRPQFASSEFTKFAQSYSFQHVTSSPHYPMSNREVERMVQTITRSSSSSISILIYPNAVVWSKPSELCLGRKLRTTVPQTKLQLTPNWTYLSEFKKDNAKLKEKQKENFDHCHRVL